MTEPTCWITPDGEGWRMRFDPPVNDVPLGWTPLYTTPPQQRKPLTDAQIETLWHEDTSCDMPDELKQFRHTARAIEAVHGIK
jgi:hypothetical protein